VAGGISVIVPCHNYAEYVTDCIESIRCQKAVNDLEIIVIDDASTDESWRLIARATADKRIDAIRHPTNVGAVATYNEGLARAHGDFVVILSADDFAIADDALATQRSLLLASPTAAFAFSDIQVVASDGRAIATMASPVRGPLIPGHIIFSRLIHGNFIPHSGTMVRRSALIAAGQLNEELLYTHDWDQWFRLTHSADAAHCPRRLYAYRMHDRQLHTRDYSRSMTEWRAVLDRARAIAPAIVTAKRYRRSIADGFVRRAHAYLARGQLTLGRRDLLDAMRTDPLCALDGVFVKALIYLCALIVPGLRGRLLPRIR
jgi:glycosyltransferase involved in cell wall biosynthesis